MLQHESRSSACCGASREAWSDDRTRAVEPNATDGGRGADGLGADEPPKARRAPFEKPSSLGPIVEVPGGIFQMGSADPSFPADAEGPVRLVRLDGFRIGAYAVSNGEFASFVADTGHVTDAERFGWSFVFQGFLPSDHPPTRAVPGTPWWRQVYDADWRRPEGPGSSIDARGHHPVVHVSWNDAAAYAAWAGGRLPSEAEWEYAARGGLGGKRFPWGDELTPAGEHRCNVWQGTFPNHDSGDDGFRGTAPVDAFEPNGYGLYNVSGNVWEWCSDWFGTRGRVATDGVLDDPQGASAGPGRVIKGGSYLCHDSYCNRYRVAARTHNAPDSTTGHMGFRVVYPA